MNRSLMVIFVMGVIAMVMLTMFGSFFVGKVGGAESVTQLRSDLAEVFGSQMVDPASLEVKIVAEGETTGILIAYDVDPVLAKSPRALSYQMRRVSTFVLGEKEWRRRIAWIDLELRTPGGKLVKERFVNKSRKPPVAE